MKVGDRGRIKPEIVQAYRDRDRADVTAPVIESHDHKGKSVTGFENEIRATGKKHKRTRCEFCSDINKAKRCDLCPRVIANANPDHPQKLWGCDCWLKNPQLHLEAGEPVPAELLSLTVRKDFRR